MMPATPARPREEPSAHPFARATKPPAQGLRLDEVGEGPLTVDLDHRDRLAIPRFELRVAADVHRLELGPADLCHDLERALAQRTVLGVVDDDAAQG